MRNNEGLTMDQLAERNSELVTILSGLESESEYIRKRFKELDLMFGKNLLAMQAAIIEWRTTGDAKNGMDWIFNTLLGSGELPSEEEKNAQAYFDREYAPIDAGLMELHVWFYEQRRNGQLKAERDALRETGLNGQADTRAAADICFQLIEECDIPPSGSLVQHIDGMRDRIAELESQPLCVKSDSSMREATPLCVKLPMPYDINVAGERVDWEKGDHFDRDEIIEAIRAAGGTVTGGE